MIAQALSLAVGATPLPTFRVLPVEDVENNGLELGAQGHRYSLPMECLSSRQGGKDRRGGWPLPEGVVVSAGVSIHDPRLRLRISQRPGPHLILRVHWASHSAGYEQQLEPFALSMGAVSRCTPVALLIDSTVGFDSDL